MCLFPTSSPLLDENSSLAEFPSAFFFKVTSPLLMFLINWINFDSDSFDSTEEERVEEEDADEGGGVQHFTISVAILCSSDWSWSNHFSSRRVMGSYRSFWISLQNLELRVELKRIRWVVPVSLALLSKRLLRWVSATCLSYHTILKKVSVVCLNSGAAVTRNWNTTFYILS